MYKYYSLSSLLKSNRAIDRALLKYGFSNFQLEILEYCTLEDLLDREQFYLDTYKPVYNIATIAGSTLGYKHSQEYLNKMKNFVLTDEMRAKKVISAINASTFNRYAVNVKNIVTGENVYYVSMTEAAKALNVSRAAVSQAVSKNTLVKKIYSVSKKQKKKIIR